VDRADFSLVALKKGYRRRISLHGTHKGREPCVMISLYFDEDVISRIRIRKSEAAPVVKAIEVATSTKVPECGEDTGTLTQHRGFARFAVSGTRYLGRPGVTFQLIARNGEAHGKPKSLRGDEFEALDRACAALEKL
jgi:hypothetical protein